MKISFHLDGDEITVDATPDRRLIDILREDLSRTAAKKACAIGRCGACMVLVDGTAMNACLLMAWQLDGRAVITPEGLGAVPEAGFVRQGLIEENAFQCGYCAPGFSVTLTALLLQDPGPDEDAIRAALSGNLCRCTGYHSILRGALRAVQLRAEEARESRTPA